MALSADRARSGGEKPDQGTALYPHHPGDWGTFLPGGGQRQRRLWRRVAMVVACAFRPSLVRGCVNFAAGGSCIVQFKCL